MSALLGVGGYAGSGKDTVADYLVSAYGWKRDAFADRMRKALLALDPIVESELESGFEPYVRTERLSEIVASLGWDRCKREYDEVRRLLQKFGTEAGRDIHGDYVWVNLLFNDYRKGHADFYWDIDAPCDLVIPDCRFKNELDAVRGYGGTLLWVERPGVGPVNAHASDNSVSALDFDYTVVNEGSLEDLYQKINQLVKDLS